MRKNKSVKNYSVGRGRGSQGKEISIELEPSLAKLKDNASRGVKNTQNSQLTDRLDRSNNPISHNILKDIMNYSHISQTHLKSNKGTTLATYDRHQDIISQFNKISKKASLGDVSRRDSHKLVIDQHIPSNSLNLASPCYFN